MRNMRRTLVGSPLALLVVSMIALALPQPLAAQGGGESFDRAMIAKIRDEGLNHSQAWPMLDTLATVFGPRLTASPAFMRAATWARDHLAAWGLASPHLESWAVGRGGGREGFRRLGGRVGPYRHGQWG